MNARLKGTWSHGTVSGYRNHDCRCVTCVGAFLAYKDRDRARARARDLEPQFSPTAKRCVCNGARAVDEDGDVWCVKCGKLAP